LRIKTYYIIQIESRVLLSNLKKAELSLKVSDFKVFTSINHVRFAHSWVDNFFYFGWSDVYSIFNLTFVYNCYVPTYFDVKTCFQQNRYVFDVIVTSWALFVFCISGNFARDIWTVFEEIKHLRSRAPEKYFTRNSTKYRKQITLMTSQWRQIRIDFVGNKF
jgi:hypothetical protein